MKLIKGNYYQSTITGAVYKYMRSSISYDNFYLGEHQFECLNGRVMNMTSDHVESYLRPCPAYNSPLWKALNARSE